jgi:C1A family cysteine protease
MPEKFNHMKRVLNCVPSPKQDSDWKMSHAVSAQVVPAAQPAADSVDLREAWWAVNDQGYTGSCVGWASTDGVLRWHFTKANIIKPTEMLSVRYIWMASKETDEFTSRPTTFIELEGTSLKSALDIARKYGVVKEDILPFGSAKLYSGDANTFYALASQMRISSYFNLGVDLNQWRQWLHNQGPIITRLNVDATWDNAASTKGVLNTYQPSTARGGHAVTLVGYTSDYFIVRNSWGTAWGDGGFAYASNAYAQVAFTEAYGAAL